MTEPLFHLISRPDWDAVGDLYAPPSLTTEGFVHLSTSAQVPGTATMFYADVPDLLVLEVSVPADDPRLRWEESIGPRGLELFPHFHAPIPRALITAADPWAEPVDPAEFAPRRIVWEEDPDVPPPLPLTAHEARIRLEAGSRRFARLGEPGAQHTRLVSREAFGLPSGPDDSLPQEPFAAVLSCADARVPVEVVLGAATNELFVVRVAGNVPGRESLGSLHYAVENLSTLRVVTVLGHSGCGAVTAAVDALLNPESYLSIVHDAPLRSIVDALLAGARLAVRAVELEYGRGPMQMGDSRAPLIELAVVANAALTAHALERDLAARPDVDVVYATYDLHRRGVGLPTSAGWSAGLHPAPTSGIELEAVLRGAARAILGPA